MARSLHYHRVWGQLSTTCSILKQPNGELLVAVNHIQLRTMASEMVDPIDWSHPPPSSAEPPERLVHSINQCTQLDSNVQPQHVRQPPCLCGHSGHKITKRHVIENICLRYLLNLLEKSENEWKSPLWMNKLQSGPLTHTPLLYPMFCINNYT